MNKLEMLKKTIDDALANAGRSPRNKDVITKSAKLYDVKYDAKSRTIEGYAATWDVDYGGDKIHPGAFKKTIDEGFPAGKVKVLWQHDDRLPIGKPIEMREDAKGLWVRAYISDTRLGNEALTLVEDGILDSFSIGYLIPKGKAMLDDEGIRHIYEIKLLEFSIVTYPMNDEAVITGIKSRYSETELVESIKGILESGGDATEVLTSLNSLLYSNDSADSDSALNDDHGETHTELATDDKPGDGAGDKDIASEIKHLADGLRDFAKFRIY